MPPVGGSYPQASYSSCENLSIATTSGLVTGIVGTTGQNRALAPPPKTPRNSRSRPRVPGCPNCLQRELIPSSDFPRIQGLELHTWSNLDPSHAQKQLIVRSTQLHSFQYSRCRKHGERVFCPVTVLIEMHRFGIYEEKRLTFLRRFLRPEGRGKKQSVALRRPRGPAMRWCGRLLGARTGIPQ